MRPHLTAAAAFTLMMLQAQLAFAQQSLNEVLSFLLTNRSVPTGDFVADAQAAAATRDTIAEFVLAEVTALPINSPASGFTYRLDPTLGIDVRSSRSFGPFFVERSLTGGRGQASLELGHTRINFDTIDGRKLRDGALVATASRLKGDPQPFDAETLTLRLQARTFTASGQVGLTDRLDVSAAVPFVKVSFSGERIDTYRGTALEQANAIASASGFGDMIVRAKYNVMRRGASGLAVAGEGRIPTGETENLLGGGQWVYMPRVIGSFERDRFAIHGNMGYSMGGLSNELALAAAITVVAGSRVTLIAEGIGRRIETGGRLTYVTTPHPSLIGVETIRLSAAQEATNRVAAVAGFRWNVAQRWLLNANVMRPLTTPGLNARWVLSVMFDCFLGE